MPAQCSSSGHAAAISSSRAEVQSLLASHAPELSVSRAAAAAGSCGTAGRRHTYSARRTHRALRGPRAPRGRWHGSGLSRVGPGARARCRSQRFCAERVDGHVPAPGRLQREGQAAARFTHPNICTVHEVDQFEGRSYLVMEYFAGRTLAQMLAESPFPSSGCSGTGSISRTRSRTRTSAASCTRISSPLT